MRIRVPLPPTVVLIRATINGHSNLDAKGGPGSISIEWQLGAL
jgi:hypothetical protein